jgi:asparagine synthase (glutamine-hydrolysing)
MEIALDPAYPWREAAFAPGRAFFAGDQESAAAVLRALEAPAPPAPKDISDAFLRQRGQFAVIAETPDLILAGVDAVRSLPLFYAEDGQGRLRLSNAARLALSVKAAPSPDPDSLLEARMAGYVTGRATLYKGLRQVLPGEWLLWDKRAGELQLTRYYVYSPEEPAAIDDDAAYVDRLAHCMEGVFDRLFASIGDAPVLLPLSGGLDSRLLACKFKERGHKRILTFSYGPRGNLEAATARKVACALDLPWLEIPSRGSLGRAIARSGEFRRYFDFADGLSSQPFVPEVECFLALRERGLLEKNAVVVNGQSGDFLTGGHIHPCLVQPQAGIEDVIERIRFRHYSLWEDLDTPENLSRIRARIQAVLAQCPGEPPVTPPQLAARYEFWEWQERQCKLVVNGQRLYDFLGLAWELPLWDFALMRFFGGVPLAWRMGQKLYKAYLYRYDYKGAFSTIPQSSYGYFGHNRFWMPYFLKVMSMALGRFGERWGEKLSAYGHHYGNLYAMLGPRFFLSQIGRATVPPASRGTSSLFCELWLRRAGLL